MTSEREHWMDALRGASVLLVAIWHVFSVSYDTIPTGIDWLNNVLSVFRIPMLMFLSGLLLDRSLSKGPSKYVTGKLRRIAWPLFVWSIVLLLIGWPAADAGSIWFWLGGGGALWYLGTLLGCYAIGMLVRFVHPGVVLAIGIPLMQFIDTDIAYLYGLLWFGLFFFAGATLSRWLDRWMALRWFIPALCLAASIAWAVYSATTHGYAPRSHWRPFLFALLGVMGVIWFAPRMPRVKWLEWVGRRSIVFYVAHVPVIYLTAQALGTQLPLSVAYPIIIGTMLGVSYVLARYLDGSILFEFPRFRILGRRRVPV